MKLTENFTDSLGNVSETYDETNKVVPESSPCILVARSDLYIIAPTVPTGVVIFGVRTIKRTWLTLVDVGGTEYDITVAPMLCLGFLALSESSLTFLKSVRQILSSWSDYDFPLPTLISKSKADNSVSTLLSTGLIGRLNSYASHVTRLSNELFRLRSAHEEMLNAFSDIERFVAASGLQPCNITFDNPTVSGEFIAPATEIICQILPVSTFGLSVVQIHIQNWAGLETPLGGISADLYSLEDHQLHQSWSISQIELKPGWVNLAIDAGLGGSQRTPVLFIRPLGDLGALPPLSLGEIQPLPAFRPRVNNVDGHEIAVRSLALRTWSGLPGVQPPGFDMRSSGTSKVHQIPVPFTMFRDVKMVPNGWAPDFNPVEYVAESRGVLCHPPPTGTTWGELQGISANGQPFRLSARATVRSARSNVVEFGLAYVAGGATSVRAAIAASTEVEDISGLVFSGWHRVVHGTPALLSVLITDEHAVDGSVFFATRMADNEDNSFAWANFYDLRKTLLEEHVRTNDVNNHGSHQTVLNGFIEPVSMLEGDPLPIALLESVENALDAGNADAAPVGYVANRRSIICHPPMIGITLGRIIDIPRSNQFWLTAQMDIGNDRSQPVEFCLLVSTLSVNEILLRLETSEAHIQNVDFVSSGWQTATYGRDLSIEVDTYPLQATNVTIYFATKMAGTADTNNFAWAYFKNVRMVYRASATQRIADNLSEHECDIL